jgi:hypothetical protein
MADTESEQDIRFADLNVSSWQVAGTRIAEIGATLLTFKSVPQRPVWSKQFQ